MDVQMELTPPPSTSVHLSITSSLCVVVIRLLRLNFLVRSSSFQCLKFLIQNKFNILRHSSYKHPPLSLFPCPPPNLPPHSHSPLQPFPPPLLLPPPLSQASSFSNSS